MDEQRKLSVGRRFQRKINEELKAKEADIEARRVTAAEHIRREEIGSISGLEIPDNKCSGNNMQTSIQPNHKKHVKKWSDLPEIDTRHMDSIPRKPTPLPSPPLSGIIPVPQSRSEYKHSSPQSESKLMSQLQAELGHQRNRIERLERNLESKEQEVNLLSAERDKVEKEQIEAICHGDKERIANLNETVSHLLRLLDDARQKRRELEKEVDDARRRVRELENEVDERRSLEQDLRRQLDEVKCEKVGLIDEIGVLKNSRSPESVPDSHFSKNVNKAKKAYSSRSGLRAEKTRYFSVPRGERFTTVALCKGVVNSSASGALRL